MTGMGRSVVVIAPANYFRMALQRYLQRLGFDVRVAADLGEAVAEARRVEASLFVLDLNPTVALADLELLRRLSTSGSLIYLAENGKRALIERLAIHTDGLVIRKPLSFADLEQAVHEAQLPPGDRPSRGEPAGQPPPYLTSTLRSATTPPTSGKGRSRRGAPREKLA